MPTEAFLFSKLRERNTACSANEKQEEYKLYYTTTIVQYVLHPQLLLWYPICVHNSTETICISCS